MTQLKTHITLPLLGARDQNQMAQELVVGTGPVNVMISAKEEDDLIRRQYNSALRPVAGELRTC